MVRILAWAAWGLLGLVTSCLSYLFLLALASARQPRPDPPARPSHRFAVAIPAHNEEATIARTVERLQEQDYPADLFDVFIVADNCTDNTAEAALATGAICFERHNAEQRGKGYALAWLFERILNQHPPYDAIVVFDADTVVDPGLLRVMDAKLCEGCQVIQGNHVISNPTQGWFAAIMYIAFVMDNRLRNWGRSSLGLSPKLMGDAMCFSREILTRYPWEASSLTEDSEYRALLLLNGVRVVFAPNAIAYGEMVTSLGAARHQRARWMHGRADVTRRLAPRLLAAGLRNRNPAQIDGAIEQWMPSFSTLVVIALASTGLWGLLARFTRQAIPRKWLAAVWAGFAVYPPLGLLLERAPLKLYVYLAFAPFYVAWRTGLRVWVRVQRGSNVWVRTPRSTETSTVKQEAMR